jgi:hypothetical protein
MTSILVLLVLGWIGALALLFLWTFSQLLRPDRVHSAVDPITGARDRRAVYRPSGPLIQPHPNVLVPIPDHLTTQEEMVAWMTKEMPEAVKCRSRGAA